MKPAPIPSGIPTVVVYPEGQVVVMGIQSQLANTATTTLLILISLIWPHTGILQLGVICGHMALF